MMLSAIDPLPREIARARRDARSDHEPDSRLEIDTFVREHWPQAYRSAYLLLCDRQRAEDVAQETVLAALERRRALDTGRPLRPWIERVATNRALDVLRSAETRRTVATDTAAISEQSSVASDETTDPELTRALSVLTPDDRAAVILRHVLGHGVSDIARFFGVGEGAARTRLHRAISKVRQELEGGPDGTPD